MFVERQELVSNIRELKSHIDAEIKILGGNVRNTNEDFAKLYSIVELLNTRIGELERRCLNS